MAFFGDGLAFGPDLQSAVRQAVEQALAPLDGPPSLVFVFVGGGGADPGAGAEAVERAGAEAMAAVPGIPGRPAVIGCTASGVIGAGHGVEDAGAVSAWAAMLPGARVTPFRLDTERAPDGVVVAGMPVPAAEDRIAVLLADPYRFPVDAFVAESTDQLGGLPIVGGLAGDPARSAGAAVRLYLDGEVITGGAVGVLIGGPLEVATVVSQGCRPVGPPMVVTRAAGNEIAELAGRQALPKLEGVVTALPEAEQMLAAEGLHIGIAMDEYADDHDRGDFLVRSVIGADPLAGTLTIGDVVEVGQTVRFQVRDAVTAAADLDRLLSVFGTVSGIDPVGGALLFSCNGRGAAFFGTADHDVDAVRRVLAPEAVGGFFAAGEIGPIGGRNHVHGFTASILMFGPGTGG
ncbi:MAG TPA: FIST N-terminal domain-containing protein [Streptosporangiaceae bacterium]|nr:FIST N-terminal domain-containing protein [Streptosporangiaceae bacterium]